jgi:putative oxygen-independent coproporphyrinogen III oxidase
LNSLYIHIPFCKSRCIYCDFFSSTLLHLREQLTAAICGEIILRRNYLCDNKINTIYFGGGTPSLLQHDDFEKIFETINKNFLIQNNAEITLEANPDDLNSEFFEMIKNFPVNRLSIGIQSFNNDFLKILNRRHTAQQAVDAVKNAQNNGFQNISIDLIYGLPNQSFDLWKNDLKTAFSLGVQHISAYGLTIEKSTKLWQMRENNEIKPVSDDLMLKMYEYTENEANKHDFEHYEISNYALPGFRSKHNSAYWKMQKYLGAGPSAHSFDGISRQWNTASVEDYIDAIKTGKTFFEKETLTTTDKFNDYIMVSLRTAEGADLEYIKQNFDAGFYNYLIKNAEKYISEKHIEIKNNKLRLTRKGVNISNLIISELFKL